MNTFIAKATTIFLTLLFSFFSMEAQTSVHDGTHQDALPAVFLLGDYDVQYEDKMPGYKTLLEACDGNMENAYGKLTGMMLEMEAYADLSDYDLKGINAWMHFFWRKDGTIEHIGFHLKPTSKNTDTNKLKDFLNEFANNYRLPLKADFQFAHYSSFAFPLKMQMQNRTAKNGN